MAKHEGNLNSLVITRRKALAVFTAGVLSAPIRANAVSASKQTGDFPFVLSADFVLNLLTELDGAVRLLDASSLRSYRAEHIPNATHVFWEDTVDPNYPVFGAVVTQGFEQQQRLDVITRFGVEPDEQIVVYDRDSGFRAARIVWFLRLLGFSFVSILDGGIDAWKRAGGSTQAGVNEAPPVQAKVNPVEGFYVVTEALRQRLDAGNSHIVDVRSESELTDTLDGQIPVGRIPGSVPLPWPEFVDSSTGLLRSQTELNSAFEAANISTDSDIVIVARFGVESALSWIVFRQAGFERALTYDRGWVEWASTPGLPIESLDS